MARSTRSLFWLCLWTVALVAPGLALADQGPGEPSPQTPPSETLDDPLLDGLLGEPDAVVLGEGEPESESETGLSAVAEVATPSDIGRLVEVEVPVSSEPEVLNPLRGEFRVAASFLNFDGDTAIGAEDDALLTVVGRTILSHPVGETFAFELNTYVNLSRVPGGGVQGAFTSAGANTSIYRSPHLAWDIWDSGQVSGQVGVDRIYLSWQKSRFSGAMGRFPINHSVTQIFTPNDFFAPFSATAINTAYKPGVDALRMAFSMGHLSSLELNAVLGYDDNTKPDWGKMALLARLATVQWGFEWSLLGGKVAERWVTGASVQGDIRGLNIRAEGHLGLPDEDGDGELDKDGRDPHGRAAIGVSGTFPWQAFTTGLEYSFISDGARKPGDYASRSAEFFPDDLAYLAGHYIGVNVSMEIVPIVSTSVISLVNLVDGSGLIGAFVRYDASDRADINLGLYLPWGDDSFSAVPVPRIGSEFGLSPMMIFLDARVYF